MSRIEPCRIAGWWWAVALCLLLAPALAVAQVIPGLSPADRQDIQQFTLNENVLARLQAVASASGQMDFGPGTGRPENVQSLDDMAKRMIKADDRIQPMLKRHGFTPRGYLVANLAVLSTVMTVRYAQQTGEKKLIRQRLEPDNVRFYKRHKQAMDELAGKRSR